MLFVPLGALALSQEVLVVEQEFVEAGAGDADEAEFSLGGGGGCATALGDILAAATCGLGHLSTSRERGSRKRWQKLTVAS